MVRSEIKVCTETQSDDAVTEGVELQLFDFVGVAAEDCAVTVLGEVHHSQT